jgi:hypothetical protein
MLHDLVRKEIEARPQKESNREMLEENLMRSMILMTMAQSHLMCVVNRLVHSKNGDDRVIANKLYHSSKSVEKIWEPRKPTLNFDKYLDTVADLIDLLDEAMLNPHRVPAAIDLLKNGRYTPEEAHKPANPPEDATAIE